MATKNEIGKADDNFSKVELDSLIQGLKEAVMIKKGELKPISMSDIWDEC